MDGPDTSSFVIGALDFDWRHFGIEWGTNFAKIIRYIRNHRYAFVYRLPTMQCNAMQCNACWERRRVNTVMLRNLPPHPLSFLCPVAM